MSIKVPITTSSVDVTKADHEYVSKIQDMFKEKIVIDRTTGVYQKWPTTQYVSPHIAMSKGLLSYSHR